MQKKFFAVVFAASFAAITAPAHANWYAGVGIGQTTIDIDAADAEDGLSTYLGVPFGSNLGLGETWSSSADDSDNGFRIFAGYKVNPSFAIEGAYVDLGEFSATASVTAPGVGTATATIAPEASGFELAGLGLLPAGPGSLFAKAGLFRWDVDTAVTIVDPPFAASASVSDDGFDFLFGVGYQLEVGQFGLRAEWTRYNDVGDENTTGQSDVDWLGVSGFVKF